MIRRAPRKPDGEWTRVQDDKGRLLGTFKIPGHDALRAEIATVKEFLIRLAGNSNFDNEEGVNSMSKNNNAKVGSGLHDAASRDCINMVFLAGIIKSLRIKEDGEQGFCLIDPGGKSKFLPCTIYGESELVEKLSRFQKDDFIQVRGWLRGWSQKKNDVWENHVDVRITEIKNDPPKRANQKQSGGDDDMAGVPW